MDYNTVSLKCSLMIAEIPPLEKDAHIRWASDKILTSRKHDKDLALLVLDYGEKGKWKAMTDEQKILLSLRLTFALSFLSGVANSGNTRLFSHRDMYIALANLVTDRWHRLAGLWTLMAHELNEGLRMTFERVAYRKPSKMMQEILKERN